MNSNYRIESNSGLKTATLMNNKYMNSNYLIESNSGLNGSNLMNNNSMNNNSMNNNSMNNNSMNNNSMNNNSMNNYSKENKSGLKTATLENNKIMDNHTNILDEPVPHIGVATHSSTSFRRIIRNLKDTTRKAANTAKRKWNE